MDINREYSKEFDEKRKSRVMVSFYKYGPARDNFASGRVDAIGSLELCLEKFKKTEIPSIYLMLLTMQCSGICFPFRENISKLLIVQRVPELLALQ